MYRRIKSFEIIHTKTPLRTLSYDSIHENKPPIIKNTSIIDKEKKRRFRDVYYEDFKNIHTKTFSWI